MCRILLIPADQQREDAEAAVGGGEHLEPEAGSPPAAQEVVVEMVEVSHAASSVTKHTFCRDCLIGSYDYGCSELHHIQTIQLLAQDPDGHAASQPGSELDRSSSAVSLSESTTMPSSQHSVAGSSIEDSRHKEPFHTMPHP